MKWCWFYTGMLSDLVFLVFYDLKLSFAIQHIQDSSLVPRRQEILSRKYSSIMETACAFQVVKYYTYSNFSANSQLFVSAFCHLISSPGRHICVCIWFVYSQTFWWFLSPVTWRCISKWSNMPIHLNEFWYYHGKAKFVTLGLHLCLYCILLRRFYWFGIQHFCSLYTIFSVNLF